MQKRTGKYSVQNMKRQPIIRTTTTIIMMMNYGIKMISKPTVPKSDAVLLIVGLIVMV